MAILEATWRGASRLVDASKVRRIGALYVAEARVREMSKWPAAIITQSFANPLLYLTAVGIGIGSLIDTKVDGVSYLVFLAPALLASAAIQSAGDETMFPTLEGFKWRKTFFATNATPMTPKQIVHGVLLAAMVRTLFAIIAYYLILLAFGAAPNATSLLAIPSALIAGAAFGVCLMAATAYAMNDDGFMNVVGRFIVTPMFLFSGTYYPLDSMPVYLQPIGWISPLWHATEIGRFFTYGSDVPPLLLLVHFVYFVVIFSVGLFFCYRKFSKRLGS